VKFSKFVNDIDTKDVNHEVRVDPKRDDDASSGVGTREARKQRSDAVAENVMREGRLLTALLACATDNPRHEGNRTRRCRQSGFTQP
jgi:hypothetical protein